MNPYATPKTKTAVPLPKQWWKVWLRRIAYIVFGPPVLFICAMILFVVLTAVGIVDDYPTMKYKHWLEQTTRICQVVPAAEKEECLRPTLTKTPADFD